MEFVRHKRDLTSGNIVLTQHFSEKVVTPGEEVGLHYYSVLLVTSLLKYLLFFRYSREKLCVLDERIPVQANVAIYLQNLIFVRTSVEVLRWILPY